MNFDDLRYDTIGYGCFMEGPYGKRLITYADYTASGKPVGFLENYFLKLGETYANTHTDDDFTGRYTTQLYLDAKEKIRKCVGANEKYCVFTVGTGATGAIDKIIKILGIYKTPEYFRKRNAYIEMSEKKNTDKKGFIISYENKFEQERPVVFISSYEHHSNEIQWREGYVEIVKIGLDQNGIFDLQSLKRKVNDAKYRNRIKIGSFSAASNVTGLKSPVYEIAKIMHQSGGYVFFDYAASAPYVEINMTKDEKSFFDGIYVSLHKFIGGTGATGVLILNRDLYNGHNVPCSTGGGTVKYVTNDDVEYLTDYEKREDAGTSGIMQVIRGAMALELKKLVGVNDIEKIEKDYVNKAMNELKTENNIEILGNKNPDKRLAILSFNVKYENGYLHHAFVSTLLNDLFGIQSRSGCLCAGPYMINLLDINKEDVNRYTEAIDSGFEIMKPGTSRVNFHYTLDKQTFYYIISAIKFVANYGYLFLKEYKMNCEKGTWIHKSMSSCDTVKLDIQNALSLERKKIKKRKKNYKSYYKKYMRYANKKRLTLIK